MVLAGPGFTTIGNAPSAPVSVLATMAQAWVQRHAQCFFQVMPVIHGVAGQIDQQNGVIADDVDHHDEADHGEQAERCDAGRRRTV